MDWYLIDEAPKDETVVLLSDGEHFVSGAFVNGRWVVSTGIGWAWEGDGEYGGLADVEIEPKYWAIPNLPEQR
jgi:hypothetical protein